MHRQCHARRGFTLIDALTAGAACLTLGALATASLRGLSAAELRAQDRANLMTIGQAAAQWSADHQGLIPGAPGASARELLNDPNAEEGLALDAPGLATQPFDWASPLAWGYLTQEPPPERRDERFVKAFGLVPVFNKGEGEIADTTHPGPLGVLRDPAQDEVSLPYLDVILPDGVEDTYFTPQIAGSYVAAREFLWWGQGEDDPRWAANPFEFWGRNPGVSSASDNNRIWLPGKSSAAHDPPVSNARDYRPYVDRVGNPSQKIYLANGTRFQREDLSVIDHGIDAQGAFGGAFADIGAWADYENPSQTLTRAWPSGLNQAGQDMERISFRHGDAEAPRGHTLRYDGSVILMEMDEARDPALWMPRGASLHVTDVPELFRDAYEHRAVGPHPYVARVYIW
jgi:hypothetical protein